MKNIFLMNIHEYADRQTDKYFISRSGQTIDIEQNLQIKLQIETWHTIDKYGEYVQ